MALTKAFYDAVQDQDILKIRVMMKDSLLFDPSCKTFNAMADEAKNIKGLYDPHDGTVFNNNCSEWNDDYMNDLLVDLVDNFSHERIEHTIEVINYLHPLKQEEPKSIQKNESAPKAQSGNAAQDRLTKDIDNKEGLSIVACTLIGAVAGGAVCGIGAAVGGLAFAGATAGSAASVAGWTATGAIAGAAVGAGIGYTTNRRS